MNKHLTQSLKFFLLLVLALSSGCGPVTAIPSPTLTPAPSQTPTPTVTPSPTNTPEPIHPQGTLIYSDYTTIYTYDFQSQESKSIFIGNPIDLAIGKEFIYFRGTTDLPNKLDLYRINFDGSDLERLTTDGDIASFEIDSANRYLAYIKSDQEKHSSIAILNLADHSSNIIAKESDHHYNCLLWSPDGEELLFVDGQSLFRYTLKNKETTELLLNAASCSLSWLPDEKNISLIAQDNQTWGVYILNPEKRTLKKFLVDDQLLQPSDLAWSPKGDMVVYETYEADKQLLTLNLINITNGKTVRLYERGIDDWTSYHPVWSLDGNYIVYFTIPFPNGYPITLNIYEVNSSEHSETEVPGKWIVTPFWIYR